MESKVRQAFWENFGKEPEFVVRAPGRVNLIGEHVDYNDGFVMPLAIDRATWIAGRRREDRRVMLQSLDFGEAAGIGLDEMEEERSGEGWPEYLRGVAREFSSSSGWEGVSVSDIPLASGLSSSASFTLAVAGAFVAASGREWNARGMALLANRVENQWIGVNCGIMDQLASAEGRSGHAILIDCRTLEIRPVPVPESLVVVVMDTRKSRSLAGSAYNERRMQCEEAARLLGVESLRDVSLEQLEKKSGLMEPLVFRRARHVVSEIGRTLRAAEAMENGDLSLLGRLMEESHLSLRDDYEVSCRELDVIVEAASEQKGCVGARMTGAGFGGCAIALVKRGVVEGFVREVAGRYEEEVGSEPLLYPVSAVDGVRISLVEAGSSSVS